MKALGHSRGLGHLHQGKHPLLHSSPAAADHGNHGQLALEGKLEGKGDLLPDNTAHAAPQKAEVQHHEHCGVALNMAKPGDHRLGETGPFLGIEDALLIGSFPREGKRV